MKIFGSWNELVSLVFRKNSQVITLRPNQATTYTASRDAQLPPQDANSVLVSENATQTLTGKTLDGDDNTVQDLPVTALKTVLGDADKVILRDASGVPTSAKIVDANVASGANIDAAKLGTGSVDNTEFGYLNGVTSSIQTQLSGKVTGPGSATDDALARFDGTSGGIIQNSVATLSDAGALAGLTQLDVDNLRADGNTISSTDTNGDIILDPNGTGITRAVGALKSDTALRLEETGAGTDEITIQAPASIAGPYTLTLPVDDGASGEVLSTDGSGVLSWQAAGNITTGRQNFQGVKVFEGGAGEALSEDSGGINVTLTDADNRHQAFSGGATITVTMPSTGVVQDEIWVIENISNDPLSVLASDASTLDYASLLGNGSKSSARVENHGKIVLQALTNAPATNTDWRVLDVEEDGAWTATVTGWISSGSGYYKRKNNKVSLHLTLGGSALGANSSNGGTATLPFTGLAFPQSDIAGAGTIQPSTNSHGPLLALTAFYAGAGGDSDKIQINCYNGNGVSATVDSVHCVASLDLGSSGY